MILLQWSKNLETGIELIDTQHQSLFRALNTYHIKCEFNQRKEGALELVSFLENFMESHFQAEEAFQRNANYPRADSHASKHDIIKIQFKKIQTTLIESDYSEEALDQFDAYGLEYLMDHIKQADTIFCKYVQEMNEKK